MTTTQFRLFLKCTSSRAFIFCLSYFQFCLQFILPRTLDILLGQAMTVNLTPCKAKDTENLVGCFSMQIQLAFTSFICESTKMRRISVLVPNLEELFQLQILKAVSRCLYASRLLFKLPEMCMLGWHIPKLCCLLGWNLVPRPSQHGTRHMYRQRNKPLSVSHFQLWYSLGTNLTFKGILSLSPTACNLLQMINTAF